jgi:hypothetical protein
VERRPFAARGIAFTVVACALIAIALNLQTWMIAVSLAWSLTLLAALVLVEAAFSVANNLFFEDREGAADPAFRRPVRGGDRNHSHRWHPEVVASHSSPLPGESHQQVRDRAKAA